MLIAICDHAAGIAPEGLGLVFGCGVIMRLQGRKSTQLPVYLRRWSLLR